jgi:hypothetical protein
VNTAIGSAEVFCLSAPASAVVRLLGTLQVLRLGSVTVRGKWLAYPTEALQRRNFYSLSCSMFRVPVFSLYAVLRGWQDLSRGPARVFIVGDRTGRGFCVLGFPTRLYATPALFRIVPYCYGDAQVCRLDLHTSPPASENCNLFRQRDNSI